MGNDSKSVYEEALQKAKRALDELASEPAPNDLRKRMRAVAIISSVLETLGIRPILVGGNAVELYTQGLYTTVDVDLVLSGYDEAGKVFVELGFEPKASGHRHWYLPSLDLPVEIPDSILIGSEERVSEIDIDDEKIYVIGIEDLILDRLRAGVAWNSGSDMEMAKYLLQGYLGQIDLDYLMETANDSQKANNVYCDLMRMLDEIKR